jgi:hypothetical protein
MLLSNEARPFVCGHSNTFCARLTGRYWLDDEGNGQSRGVYEQSRGVAKRDHDAALAVCLLLYGNDYPLLRAIMRARRVAVMVIELTCPDCGARFVPSRDDLVRGPAWYARCPDCRPALAPPERDQ